MIYSKKRAIFLFILHTMVSAKESSDTDDDEIKQALFLVNILRSGYEKLMLGDEVETPTEKLSTCPLTTGMTLFNESHTTPSITTKGTSNSHNESAAASSKQLSLTTMLTVPPNRLAQVSSNPEDRNYKVQYPSYEEMFRRRRKFRNYRRRFMPMEYYYYYDQPAGRPERKPYKLRTFRSTNFRTMLDTDSVHSLSSFVDTPNTASRGQYSRSTRPAEPTSKGLSSAGSRLITPSPTKLKIKQEKLTKAVSTVKSEIIAENAVMPQVARELFNELKGGGLTMEQPNNRRNLKLRTTEAGKSIKFSDFVKRYEDVLQKKTTMKIYMVHSTRLPLPLPENNAYCFMNPKSALCGTNI